MRGSTIVLAVLAIGASRASSYCPLPDDPTSAVYQMYHDLPRDMTDKTRDLPKSWLRCLGATNVNEIYGTIVATAFAQPTCLAVLSLANEWASSDEIQGAPSDLNGKWPVVTNADVEKGCQPVINAVLPCLTKGIFPPVMAQVRANPCCADMLANVTAVLGMSPDVFLLKLLNYTTDVVCATQSPGYNGTTNQTCGYAWFRAFTTTQPGGNKSQVYDRLVTAVQVPDDQGCAAVQGNPFVTTTGAPVSQLFGKPIVPDSCVNPVDSLLQWLRAIPGLATASWKGIRLLDAVENGKCIQVTSMPGVCVHLANGDFATCPFVTSWKSAVFPGEGTKLLAVSSSSKAMASALVIAIALGAPW